MKCKTINKKFTRFVSLVLSLVLAMGLAAPVFAADESDFEIKKGKLVKYRGTDTEVVVPDRVTSIGTDAFRAAKVTSVTLPEGLLKIEEYSFGYSKLTTIKIPNTVTSIGSMAFQFCDNLTEITIPSSVTEMGIGVFQHCRSLTSVTIPSSLTVIENWTFAECPGITSVYIPSSVTEIRHHAFYHCNNLRDVYYGGTEEQWAAINIDDNNDELTEGTIIHYSGAMPSVQKVMVDGKPVEFNMYALGGGATNYIRVRDLAVLLNGTAAQFQVGWDGSVLLTSKTPYDGPEDTAPFNTPMSYTRYTKSTYVDGAAQKLDAIQIEYNGGGYTYYKLRDLGKYLGFNVGWTAESGIFVETDRPYDPNN